MTLGLGGCWLQFRSDASHTGFNAAEDQLGPTNVKTLTRQWLDTTGGPVESSPAISDQRLYVGSDDGHLYAMFENTGTRAWSRSLGSAVKSSPAIGDQDVFIGTSLGSVQGFALETGAPSWSAQTGSAIVSSPTLANDRLFIGSTDGSVYAFDAKGSQNCSGAPVVCTPLWTFSTGGPIESSPAVSGNLLVFGSDDHKLYEVDAGTGALRWSAVLGDRVRSSPAIANGRVFVGSDDGTVDAFDAVGNSHCSGTPTLCQPLWTAQTNGVVDSSAAVAGNSVYVAGEDGQLRSLDTTSGAPQWTAAMGSGAQSSPAVANGVVYVGTRAGALQAYTTATGQEQWSTTTGGSVLSSPAVTDGRLFAASGDGEVSAYAPAVVCPPEANTIVCENRQYGANRAEWDVPVGGSPGIEGFATDISVDHGTTVHFKVNTAATSYHADIYRLGYYGGDGARKVATVAPSVALPQVQPACLSDSSTHLVDCGNWDESASWLVPGNAVSGIYVAKLVRDDGGSGSDHMVFVVRDDEGSSPLLFQTSDTTWEAYNDYGGAGLYTVGADGKKAVKASYNRPFTSRTTNAPSYLFGAEYPMLRFLEANGYGVSYAAGVDSDRFGSHLLTHRVFLSVGHDEYWSSAQRANVEAARDHGTHLAFFSGNAMFWKTRWEASTDASATPYRTLVSYKETCDALQDFLCSPSPTKTDPSPIWTGLWRDHRFSPPSDGGRPESATTGQRFVDACCTSNPLTVDAEEAALRLWRNTTLASLAPGTSASVGDRVLGYEWDQDVGENPRPAGLFELSTTDLSGKTATPSLAAPSRTSVPSTAPRGPTVPNDTLIPPSPGALRPGPSVGSAQTQPVCILAQSPCIHHVVMYRAPSGALVFGAGTVQWSYGLDGNSDTGTTPDTRIQQATVNLLADMGTQPGTLLSNLVPATASTDTTPPTSTITSPAPGSTVAAAVSVTVSGSASDAGGGRVAGVEVSTDGGSSWHPAGGRTNWSYTFRTVASSGPTMIRSRAMDDSGNIETPGSGVTIDVLPRACPCTIFDQAAPQTVDSQRTTAVEAGVKFTSDTSGVVTGIRFYKSSSNTGTHVGNLWTASGTLLGTATFATETASGWQDATFAAPVAIVAGTTYVASYHTDVGHTADDTWFSTAPPWDYSPTGIDNTPLHMVPGNGAVDRNGVYVDGASAFPNQLSLDENYWVDVDFGP